MANELELMEAYIIWEMVEISFSWKEFQQIDGGADRTPTHNTHLRSTVCSQARNAHYALGSRPTRSRIALSSLCAWKESGHLVLHVSSFVALSLAVHHERIIFLIHSSFYHNTRTPWSTPRTPSTSRTSPSSLSWQAAPSRITLSWRPCRVAETRARQLPQVMTPKSLRLSYRINWRRRSPSSDHRRDWDSWLTGFSNIRDVLLPTADAFRRFRGSTADSDLEDGELQKMLTSPLYAQKTSVKPDAMVMQEREVSARCTQADRQDSLRSHSSQGEKALLWGNPMHCFHLNREVRNAYPSNLRGSLLEGNKDHLFHQARSVLAKQELRVESLNKCIGELQRQTEEQRLALQDSTTRRIVHERKSSPK